MRSYLVSSLVLLLLAFVSCDDDSSDGGDDGGDGVCPECSLLRQECTPIGECTFEGPYYGAPGSRSCFENGLVQVHDTATTATVTLAGEPCYTRETTGLMTTFFTPDGEVAGVMTFDLEANGVTIECDDRVFTLTPEDECPSWFPNGMTCVAGTCPAS